MSKSRFERAIDVLVSPMLTAMGFVSEADVKMLGANQPKLAPDQLILKSMVENELKANDDFMMSMSAADGPGSDFLIEMARRANIEPTNEIAMGKFVGELRAMKLGQYVVLTDKAYIKTGDNKIEEVSSYINRLEKATIALQKKVGSVR